MWLDEDPVFGHFDNSFKLESFAFSETLRTTIEVTLSTSRDSGLVWEAPSGDFDIIDSIEFGG
ncbi:hypothetical protein A7X75_05830 [Stenotrophomonas maltophilia]|nr:hypothetical protein A7X75_05830 [Stenotrophomonas maltophilia]